MKIKRIISLIIVLSIALSTNVFAFDDVEYEDFFNNPIFEIVATLNSEPSQPSSNATIIGKTRSLRDDFGFGDTEYHIYSDGSYIQTTTPYEDYSEPEYNDGLIFDELTPDEEFSLNGYKDINDKVYFEDAMLSYFGYFYNLGYLVTSSNNGGTLDYSLDDPEKFRVFESTIENVFTGEKYEFYDVNIRNIFDSGYALADVKDSNRNETTYILKLKKMAVIRVMVNGEKVKFDVLPTIVDGRTLVPVRAIFEALGADISWDGETQTVTANKDGLEIKLVIGSNIMTVGNETKTLDVPAQINDGRTLVPARAIAEAFGCDVKWNDADRAVIIEY